MGYKTDEILCEDIFGPFSAVSSQSMKIHETDEPIIATLRTDSNRRI